MFSSATTDNARPASSSDRTTGSRRRFILEQFFEGRTVAHAKFSAINGVQRKFRIDIDGIWRDNRLILHENFLFDDGERDSKTWEFKKLGDRKYLAHRQDVVRPVKAIVSNNALYYSYRLFLEPSGSKNVVRFLDRIAMVDERTLKNTAIVLKFGIPVGLVRGVFEKQDQ